MTSRQHITVTPLTPEEAIRRIPDIYDVIDCQPDEEADEDDTGFVLLAFTMLSFVFVSSCVVAVLYAFGIM